MVYGPEPRRALRVGAPAHSWAPDASDETVPSTCSAWACSVRAMACGSSIGDLNPPSIEEIMIGWRHAIDRPLELLAASAERLVALCRCGDDHEIETIQHRSVARRITCLDGRSGRRSSRLVRKKFARTAPAIPRGSHDQRRAGLDVAMRCNSRWETRHRHMRKGERQTD